MKKFITNIYALKSSLSFSIGPGIEVNLLKNGVNVSCSVGDVGTSDSDINRVN